MIDPEEDCRCSRAEHGDTWSGKFSISSTQREILKREIKDPSLILKITHPKGRSGAERKSRTPDSLA
jgi:hypothetical protein